MTFPRREAHLPHPTVIMPPAEVGNHGSEGNERVGKPEFEVRYDEGLKVGYKWYDAENKKPLFPFGFGLSYTTYAYSDLKVKPGKETTVTFTVKNTGSRAGAEIAQVYAALPPSAGEPPKRLVAWSKVRLDAGETKQVSLTIDPLYLSIYDENASAWKFVPGSYTFMAGTSSQALPLQQKVTLE